MILPSWALTTVVASDREKARSAHERGTAKIIFNDRGSLGKWMSEKKWKKSWIFPEEAFFKTLFSDASNFALALEENVITISIPKSHYQIPDEYLREMDEEYASSSWSSVVAALRGIRRAIEAGVVVEVEGKKLKSFNAFYTWAHNRYHALEEISDQWIGDDK